MKHFIPALLLLFLLSLSCNKESDFEGIGEPSIVWTTVLNNKAISSMRPIVYKDKVYFSDRINNFTEYVLVGLNKKDGKKLVETKIPFAPTDLDNHTYDNLTIFITHLGQIHCFDLETATLKWTLQESLYASKSIDSLVFGVQNNHIVKLNILNKAIETIGSVTVASTFWTGTPFFDVFKNSDGDICLSNIYSKNQQLTLSTKNLTKNTIIAEHEIYSDALDGGFSSFFKVKHDRAYYGNSEKILCRNLKTGAVEWLNSLSGSGTGGSCGSELFFGDDELFMATYGNRYLVAFDWATGAELWRIKNDINFIGFGSMENFFYYKRILYWAADSFQAVEGATGRVLWFFKDEFDTDSPLTFYHLPTADGNLLYVAGSSKILCIKMAETFVSRLFR